MENDEDSYIKKKRLKAKLTQVELVALCADSSITQSRISEWEDNAKKPTINQALIIARALNLSGAEMLKWINYRPKDWRSRPRKRLPKK